MIVGALFVVAGRLPDTVMLNVASAVRRHAIRRGDDDRRRRCRSTVGVPERRPVDVLNVAHDGLLRTPQMSALPSGSLPVGWNAYAVPTFAVVAGVPESNAATCSRSPSRRSKTPGSETLRRAVAHRDHDAAVGADVIGVGRARAVPVLLLNEAQPGLLAMLKVSVLPSESDAVGLK